MSRVCCVPSRDRDDIETRRRSYHENFYEAALYQLVGNIRKKSLGRELRGKVGGRRGWGEESERIGRV